MGRKAIGLLALLTLAGCQHTPQPLAAGSLRDARELMMNREWHDRLLSELVAARGQPRLVMSIPGGGNPPGFVVVYGLDAASGCVDAYAVNIGDENRIRIYHCR